MLFRKSALRIQKSCASAFSVACVCALAACARPSPQAEALEDLTRVTRETIAVLKTIHSPDDARARRQELMALSQRGLDIRKRMEALIGKKIPTESRRYTMEKLKENEAAFNQLMEEARRLQQDPAIWQILGESLKGYH